MDPVRSVKDDYVPPPNRTLGWGLLRWAAENYRADWRFIPSQVRTILRWYEIDEHGQFMYRTGVLQMMKGKGKSPVMASIAGMEFLGPVRFSHWDENGMPIGTHPSEPWVQLYAVNIEQTKNMVLPLHSLFTPQAIERYQIDPGQERYHARQADGTFCLLEAKTASFRSAEGARPSALFLDETWHWLESNHGHKVYATATANAAKVGGRTLMGTNAYVVGEDSIAERVHTAWQKQQDGSQRRTGLYYDSVSANPDFDIEDEHQLRAAIAAAADDAHWVDIDSILDQCYSGTVSREEVLRKYCNLVTAADDALVDPVAWGACETDEELRAGDRIVLALDGGESDDATAVVAMRVHDQLVQPIGVWEKPDGPEAKNWSVDKQEVSDLVDWVFRTYRVEAFFSDTAFWETYVNQWSEEYAPRLAIKASGRSHVAYDMKGNQKEITTQNMALVGAIEAGRVKHTGHFGLKRHVENTRKRHNRFGISFGKASRESPYKVDAYAAMLLCFIARTRLYESGKLNTVPRRVPSLQQVGGF
ncbi:hypothetical protein [Streptomyces cacaoi]|uniref:Terminase n=1 Tax=Streptomyces cacaoi TaxID=1898 RepID=A0A4Y3R0J2_STRCI|nr:hypothetical protein [Streptomyces cacaoi]GEB50437.1 terminase [Streptomyces cacaoi]